MEYEFHKIRSKKQHWTCHKCTLPQFQDELFNDFTNANDSMNIEGNSDCDVEINLPNFKKGIKIGLLNINRLLPHVHQLSTTVKTLKLQIMCVVETWLTNNIQTDEITIEDYNTLRLDRSKDNSNKQCGGGCAIYIESHIPYKPRLDLQDPTLELLWCEICIPNMSPFLVGCIYRPPDSDCTFNARLAENLEKVSSENKETLLLGDFNINCNNENRLSRGLLEVTDHHDMEQLIDQPTRVTPHSSTLIDLIFTTHKPNIVQTGVLPISISDHYLP